MGSYDNPGYSDRTPAGSVNESTGLGGSQATQVPTATTSYPSMGTTVNSAFVVPSGASTVNGDRVPAGPLDTLVGLQADLYTGPDPNELTAGLSGDAVGSTGIGHGHTGHQPGGAA